MNMRRTMAAICLLAACGLGGCADPILRSTAKIIPQPPLVPSALPQVKDIATRVQTAATADGAAAASIRSSAMDGKARTSPESLPALGQYWDTILAGAAQVQNTSQDLAGLHQRMDDLTAQVANKDAETTTLRNSLAAANAGIASEHDARIKAEQAEAKAKSDEAAHLEKLLFGVAITALLGRGASVTIGLLMHDIRITIAGGAGCLAMAIGCFLLGEVIHYRFWILTGLGAATAIAAAYELYTHRAQIIAGIKSTPTAKPAAAA